MSHKDGNVSDAKNGNVSDASEPAKSAMSPMLKTAMSPMHHKDGNVSDAKDGNVSYSFTSTDAKDCNISDASEPAKTAMSHKMFIMCDFLVSHIMHPYGSMEGHNNLA